MIKCAEQELSQKKHVVIFGGGFAGLNCTRKLASHADMRVTLIDKNNYQQFQPLLYWVPTAILSPDNAAFALRSVFCSDARLDVRMAQVSSVDLTSRIAVTTDTTFGRRRLQRNIRRGANTRGRQPGAVPRRLSAATA